jgi:predicted glycosyltransferase
VRVWIDISNSPQVAFFQPLVALLERRGHTVQVTTRDYAQTLELLRLHSIEHDVVGPRHAGAGRVGKARALTGRLRALRAYARTRAFDVALSHASHELPLVARSLGIPSAYAFDYEFATLQHALGCRAATRVVVPDAIPAERLARLGARPSKVRRYPGLKEEYYLHGFAPDDSVLDELRVGRERVLVVVRTPPEVSLYHRHGSPLFTNVLERLGTDPTVAAVVLPRTREQREAIVGLRLPSLVVPEHAIDAQSLVALSDLVVSAGGTMNREAVALGVPVYTTFAGRLGAVDETLLSDGRLRVLDAADDLALVKRGTTGKRTTRDPALLLDVLLTALDAS